MVNVRAATVPAEDHSRAVMARLRVLALALALNLVGPASVPPTSAEDRFSFRVVTGGLDYPWQLTWGPDGHLWVTEREGKRVTRVNPVNGAKTVAVTIADAYQDGDHQGVLGMALHPNLLRNTGEDFVYIAYAHAVGPARPLTLRARITRFTYDSSTQRLGSPLHIFSVPASDNHNAGRLKVGPDGKLFYSIGDLGANDTFNRCKPNRAMDVPTAAEIAARDWSTYQGKILRMNLDGSIPDDNPRIANVQSHIYSYGHRNVQGLVFGPDGQLYSSEHGPKTDDEVNIIQAGRNYGWPRVAGFIDDKAYTYDNWSASAPVPCASLKWSVTSIPPSVPRLAESSFSDPNFVPPIKTFGTVDNGFAFERPGCTGNACWPSMAPSSIEFYPSPPSTAGAIPGWGSSLLIPSLKRGTVFRVRLSADRQSVVGDAVEIWQTRNRYRDLAIHPDGKTFYIATDVVGANPGAILEFRYLDSR
jgi:PQQ-dependent dehydrogenase (s-GDH family)